MADDIVNASSLIMEHLLITKLAVYKNLNLNYVTNCESHLILRRSGLMSLKMEQVS